MTSFSSLHPVVTALYFVSVLVITMFAAHPVLLLAALLGGLLLFLRLPQRTFGFYLMMFLLVALTNPLFSHNGVTPLFFLNGNPVTLEALLYGVQLGGMLLAVLIWFRCFNEVMTDDKILYLLGRLSPKLALLLSSALRFIPLFKTRAAKIRQAQTAMGLYASDTWTDKLKGTVRVYSSLITWALENAIDTGASMKGRGYGLRGRTHYSLYTFRKTDALSLLVIAVLDGAVIAVMATGRLAFSFYPSLTSAPMDAMGWVGTGAFAVLCFLPFILEVKEGFRWKYCRSKI